MLKNVLNNSDLFIMQQPHITNLNLFRRRYPSLMCDGIFRAMMMIIIIIIINVIRWHRVVVIASNICSLNFSWISLCSDCGNQTKIFCEILTHVADHTENNTQINILQDMPMFSIHTHTCIIYLYLMCMCFFFSKPFQEIVNVCVCLCRKWRSKRRTHTIVDTFLCSFDRHLKNISLQRLVFFRIYF